MTLGSFPGKGVGKNGGKQMKEKMYTAGEIARLAGVSLKTIRFYDAKGLLKPVAHSEAGYRYYNKTSIAALQKILMLKYLGFSLQQIEGLMKDEDEMSFEEQLSRQKELLIQRKKQLDELVETIEIMEKGDETRRWDYLIRLLGLLTDEEKVRQQYETSANLERRIQLHNYSTSEQGWMDWLFERIPLKQGDKVLELGCGTGLLWRENIYRLPEGLQLLLTDRSEGMLEQTRCCLKEYEGLLAEKEIQVEYRIMDADALQLPAEEFDCIIANHMLYHVVNRRKCLETIAAALKPQGHFCCSTVGDTHMRELHELVREFDERLEMPFTSITEGFHLENGEAQLKKFFPQVECMEQDNDLLVDNVDAIYNYVYSYPGNAPCILDRRGDEFRKLLQDRIERDGSIMIHKSSGMFLCEK